MSSKNKRSKLEDSSSDSDSGPEDRNPPPTKKRVSNVTPSKSKPASGNSRSSGNSGSASASSSNRRGNPAVDGQEPSWDLGKMKKVKVRQFKGQTYIDIREYYIDKSSMDEKPGKKAISLNCLQYQALKAIIHEIDENLP